MNLEPLRNIRVRTPRLELRLASEDELVELFHVAERGIHPPEVMPFYVPWTDDLGLDAFLEFHRGCQDAWRPEKWSLTLITFLDGKPIGSQGIDGEDFSARREVSTGSWLGGPYQGKGLGTEMRVGVLELAFEGLGAEAASSGSFVHNVKSQRVSERIGYRLTGTRTMESRGEPVEHYDYRLERGEWRCPMPIEITGLEPALPLFGVC